MYDRTRTISFSFLLAKSLLKDLHTAVESSCALVFLLFMWSTEGDSFTCLDQGRNFILLHTETRELMMEATGDFADSVVW